MKTMFFENTQSIIWVFLSTIFFYFFTIVASRIAGIRSFTTNSSFDFLVTLAMGALLASTITSDAISLVEGTVALFTLFVLQTVIAFMRHKWSFVSDIVDHNPILLIDRGKILEKNLKHARVTRYELNAKLRGKGITDYNQVWAAVLEASGTVSVMKKNDAEQKFNPALLEGVMNKVKEEI
ncbi:YetF domain-containing protein [Catalinimonas sp. 4WD22]|uniref:DUF421 domain-containing protein n=1 Tax=Catalinimonas locisalis TaxID=3133978 RepID=UPI0031017272